MNRIRELLESAGEDEAPLGDYVMISGPFGCALITFETARDIQRQLDRWWLPRWVTFRDRSGSLVRLRGCDIRVMTESTAAQRAADRRYDRARRREEKGDRRPWEDDD